MRVCSLFPFLFALCLFVVSTMEPRTYTDEVGKICLKLSQFRGRRAGFQAKINFLESFFNHKRYTFCLPREILVLFLATEKGSKLTQNNKQKVWIFVTKITQIKVNIHIKIMRRDVKHQK